MAKAHQFLSHGEAMITIAPLLFKFFCAKFALPINELRVETEDEQHRHYVFVNIAYHDRQL